MKSRRHAISEGDRSGLIQKQDIDVAGLNVDTATLETLLSVDPVAWRAEVESIGKYLDEFRERVPAKLREELRDVERRLSG